ncbi:MAG TPA: NADP-dependent oxidoreductase [Catenuloplanes sp.]
MSDYPIPATAREVRLVTRPGWGDAVTNETIKTFEVPVERPGDGQMLVRNDWMLLAMAMRDLMSVEPAPDLPMPVYHVGQPPWALTVGAVVESNIDGFAVGDVVTHTKGWREYAVVGADEWPTKQDPGLFPGNQYFLTQGPTAWRGMVEVANVGEGDTVFVSGAAGGVGSLAGQIARCRGAKRVIGSAGSQAKVDFLVNELGYTDAFNYNDGPVIEHLNRIAPEGIDVYFDNVGGDQFEAALNAAAWNGRLALCGQLSGKNPTLDYQPVIFKDLTVRGFTTQYGPEDTANWNRHFSQWLREGRIVFHHTVVDGLAAAPEGLISLINGKTSGTVLVKLSDG